MTYSLPLSSILTDLDLDGLLDACALLGLEALLGLLDVVLDLEASGLNGLSTTDLEGDADLDLLLLLELPGGLCEGLLGILMPLRPESSPSPTTVIVAISTEHSSSPLAEAGSGSGWLSNEEVAFGLGEI
jgi:hypothetical protein